MKRWIDNQREGAAGRGGGQPQAALEQYRVQLDGFGGRRLKETTPPLRVGPEVIEVWTRRRVDVVSFWIGLGLECFPGVLEVVEKVAASGKRRRDVVAQTTPRFEEQVPEVSRVEDGSHRRLHEPTDTDPWHAVTPALERCVCRQHKVRTHRSLVLVA